MDVSWLPDFPEPGKGSPGLLNSYIYVFNSSSIFRNITTEVGEVSHLLALKMENFSETLVIPLSTYESSWRHNPEE
jgi:hypothetical protein